MSNPVFVKTVDNYITAAMKVLLGAAPGNTYLNQFRSFVTENGGGTKGLAAYASALANYAGTDNAALAATVVANLGITGTAATTATANVKALFDAKGAARGEAVLQLVEVMVNLQGDATWGTAANNFVNGVNAAYVYSVNTANTSTDLAVLKAAVTTTSTGTVSIPGQTFTLTAAAGAVTGVDTITGTSGDDTFRAVTGVSLETQDTLDGGAGTDTLNISAGGAVAAGVPVLKNIEIINFTNAAAGQGINLTDSTGITAFNVTSTNALSVVTVNNASLDTVFGSGKSTAAGVLDVDWKASTAGANDTFKLALGDNDANAMTVQSTADTGTIENVTIAANGSKTGANAAADAVILAASFTNKTLTVTGAGNANITNASANLTSVDASAATGNNTYTVAGAAAKTVTAGSGNDTIVTGAGADTLIGGAGADTMTGAAGNDKFVIQTSTIEDLGFDNILDFTTTADTIAFLGGVAGSATNYVEVVSTGTGFVTARSAAQTQLAGDSNLKYVVVSDAGGAGNTYVFFDGNGDGKLTTNGSDHAVILTGVATGAGIAFTDIVAG